MKTKQRIIRKIKMSRKSETQGNPPIYREKAENGKLQEKLLQN